MTRVAVIMAVYNEEPLLPAAFESMLAVGVDPAQVYVFDGAWRGGKDGCHVFAGGSGPSTDRTVQIAREFGAHVIECDGPWASQEAKRQAMFDRVDADLYFVMDADERLEGEWPTEWPDGHANLLIRCEGPNDMPGIRGEWPNGDYCEDYKPELRVFRKTDDLEIVYPGGYWADGAMIEAYADAQGTSALPVLTTLSMSHHGNDRSAERIAEKVDYYKAEHPIRAAWQRALYKAGI